MYTCAICKNEYETIEERAECELACSEKLRKEEIAKKREAYESEKKASEADVTMKLNVAEEMLKEHLRKYESIKLHNNYPYLKYLFKNIYFWF